MPITKEQREARKRSIGSSDSPAIMGVDPYKSPADVWIEKTQDVAEMESNQQIEIGNELEAPLVRWAAKELGVEIQENVHASRTIADVPFHANNDALVVRKPWGMEAKTGSSEGYGEPGTDQVPDRVLIQTAHQMLISDLELVYVPVLIARFDHLERHIYKVERNETLINLVRDKGVSFWKDHVLPKVQPDSVPSLDILKRIRRVPKSIAQVDAALVTAYMDAQARKKLSEEEEDNAKALLLAAMGDAEAADWQDATHIFTYYEQSRTGIDTKRFFKEQPDIASQYETKTVYRTLRRTKR